MITDFDIEELARAILELSDDVDDVVDAFEDVYEIEYEQFSSWVKILAPLIVTGRGLNGELFKGFGMDGAMYIRIQVGEQEKR